MKEIFFLDQLWSLLNKEIFEGWKVCLSRRHVQNVTFYVADIMSTAFDCAHQMAYPFAAESIWSGIWEASRSISTLSFQSYLNLTVHCFEISNQDFKCEDIVKGDC